MSDFRVYRSLEETVDFGPSAVAIGNFDGVHLGHRALLRAAVDHARRAGIRAGVLTFDPHPMKLVAPARAPRLLTSIAQRIEVLRSLGIERVLVLPFDLYVAQMPPQEFVDKVLFQKLAARIVVVGEDFRFGHKAAGDVAALRKLGRAYGFEVTDVAAVNWRKLAVSSTEIRKRILEGNVSRAGRKLARPHMLDGAVVPGRGIGSRQTVPTLNLDTTAEVIPRDGVYITRTVDLEDGRRWPSITNIGTRPTFGGEDRTIETFLLAPLDGETPARIRVEFCRRVRDERKFENPETLKSQILKDAGRAKTFWRRVQAWTRA
ncbi:MAG: bifunctional riboflavin kinase/FAD synthetase [Bryobacteraceae bacterium]|nr:bifunctional riboflavin kinase/FAD synthetase [Bryobacteraceae bacterium]